MAQDSGLLDVTFDSTTFGIRWGVVKIPLLTFEVPKVETKVERVRRIAEDQATRTTVGATEIADCSAEVELDVYTETVLPRMPVHGGHLVTFPIVGRAAASAVDAEYSILLDFCRILTREGPTLSGEGAEKKLVKKLGINVRYVWEMGKDRVWKCSARVPGLPSESAKALMGKWR